MIDFQGRLLRVWILGTLFLCFGLSATALGAAPAHIHTVFIILMENKNWSEIQGNRLAPYINKTLLRKASYADQYYNPPGIHPSLPNYLWLEAGTNFGIRNDRRPSDDHQSTSSHLVTLLRSAGITWKAYAENITGTACPLRNSYRYAVRHDPFVYFDDVTGTLNPNSAYCIDHIRPYTELAGDLSSNTVARYNFIIPNVCDDMHNHCGTDPVQVGDTWLSKAVPPILNSRAYLSGGALFITWDEGISGDGPIGMIVLSPLAKGHGYHNSIRYTHGSTLRSIEEIFGLTPLLGDAANQTDLSDLFKSFP